MSFNFSKRAAEREEAENSKRLREQAAAERVSTRAMELERDFMFYASSSLYRQNLTSDREGDRVIFREGAKILQVVVVKPSTFRIRHGVGGALPSEPGSDEAVDVQGDDALMDMLDAWALQR